MNKLVTRLVSFAAIGLLITAFGAVIVVFVVTLTGNPLAANVIGYTCGLILSYALNSRFTFRQRQSAKGSLKFLASFLIALAANLLTVYVAIYCLHAPKTMGSLVGLPIYTATFYLLCEKWVFK